MAFNVTELKTQIGKQGGGARPALFKITINGRASAWSFSGNQNLLVKAASIPASTIAALPINYGGRAYKLNGFRTFDAWTTTVINDENFESRNKITSWMRYMVGMMDGTRSTDMCGRAEIFEGSATVTQIGTDGEPKQTYKFFNLWPTELAEVPLDWSSDAIEEYTVTWAYDYWSHGKAASPTNVIKPAFLS